ncbi:MAG: PD-(D/E)XK nuclease family protein [Treponema sp.]|jgi:hypothetical protein|nr:PD-(D/E)XK nuclease family protein [Treponema sp.]
MNSAETILLENIDNPDACFIFPTETACSRWADHLLRKRGGTVATDKFIAWDTFKENSVRSQIQNKKNIPSVLRKIFVSCLIQENAQACGQGKEPVFTSLIRVEWAKQASQFTAWLTRFLPQLGTWLKNSLGLAAASILCEGAEKAASQLAGDDRDLFTLACCYAKFLDKHSLFEPAWETPPLNDTGKECFIFFPECLSDFGEYQDLLAASGHVKLIKTGDISGIPCDTFYYTNSRSEITEAALYIRALHEKQGVKWDAVAVCIPDSEDYEPYVLREFANRGIPFVKHSGKPLSGYPAGRFFQAILDCASRDFAFSAFANLILNKNLPWKNNEQIQKLIEFGISNNCITSWVEIENGVEKKINVWEDALARPCFGIDPDTRQFFIDLKRQLLSFRAADSFSEFRRQYFIFRERFFDMDNCTKETNIILSRCISELIQLTDIEKNYPDIHIPDAFAFFTEYLNEVIYVPRQPQSGVTILPYRTAAAAPFDCHIILGAGQDALSTVFTRMDFIHRTKRKKLGIADIDASAAFIDLHKYNSFKRSAFFCSRKTFSGFTISHSGLNAPREPVDRYASSPEFKEKFDDDYFQAESRHDALQTPNIHQIQKDGFDNWESRHRISTGAGSRDKDSSLLESIRTQLVYNERFPEKYSVSASSMEKYFQCSLIWLFERVFRLENEQIGASLMAENISGMVYHAIINLFLTELRNKDEILPAPQCKDEVSALPDEYKKLLEKCVEKIFSLFPRLLENGKIEMSALSARLLRAGKNNYYTQLQNFFSSFLSYFNGYRVIGSEVSYQAERETFYLNGKIDCILENARDNSATKGKYTIVDFKLWNLPDRDNCTGDTDNGLLNFQLPMYIQITEENEKLEIETALFYSILRQKVQVITGTISDLKGNIIIPKKDDDRIMRDGDKFKKIMTEFNGKTEQFAADIQTANFPFFEFDYNTCYECAYNRICRTTYKINGGSAISSENY